MSRIDELAGRSTMDFAYSFIAGRPREGATNMKSSLANTSTFRSAVLVAALGAAYVGCSASDDGSKVAGGKAGTAGSAATGAGGTGTGGVAGGGASTGSGGSGGGIVTTGGAGGEDSGCNKIDFLFVVDNSVSMQNEQEQLVAAFPGFISAIENTVKSGSDYHILVTDTDAWGRCDTANPWTGMNPGSSTCNDYIKNTVFEECDRVRGAGVVHPAGQAASNMKCDVPAGRRYLKEGDPNISSTFACMAKVGLAGHPSERPMEGIVEALSPALAAPGGCNEGFLRDDALLVITFISDDPNYEDTGTPDNWYDAVVAAKKGNADSVVTIGFTPGFDGCSANAGGHWTEFINKFKYNLRAPVCATDYSAAFAQAITVIDEGCNEFTPPR